MKYSIVIPHFNRPDLIIKTIKSFDDLKNKEIIIVDDISTEENFTKLQNNILNLNNSNIKLIQPESKTYLTGARIKGLKKAIGKWVFFIDDDDLATNEFIEFLNNNNLDENNNFYRFPFVKKYETKTIKLKQVKPFIVDDYADQISTYLFNKEWLLNLKEFLEFEDKNYFYEDTIWNMLFYSQKNIIHKYINVISIEYIATNSIMSSTKTSLKFETVKKTIDKILSYEYKLSAKYVLKMLLMCNWRQSVGNFDIGNNFWNNLKTIEKNAKINIKTYFQLNIVDFFRSFSYIWNKKFKK